MKTKFASFNRIFIFVALVTLPFTANAEYYLVSGPVEPVVSDSCAHRAVYRVHRVKYKCACAHRKHYYRTVYRKRSHYSITVYYPVPVYPTPCGAVSSCGGFIAPSYYWVPAPYAVYYTRPDDRLVGNGYEYHYDDPSLDTGTADNDIY